LLDDLWTVCGTATDTGVIYFGTSEESSREALDYLAEEGVFLDAMRIRSFPFGAILACWWTLAECS